MRYLGTHLLLVLAFFILPLSTVLVSGEVFEERAYIDIEQYEEKRMEFDSGDRITISLQLTSYAYPVSVLLIKGEEDYQKFKDSDSVDIDAMRNGEDVDFENVSYRVVGGFSARNVTEYDNSLSLGEHDTYYVLIILYRDRNMSYNEILTTRATTVDYRMEYRIENKEVPYYLIPIAIFFLIAGLGLIGYYFWPREEEEGEEPEKTDEEIDRGRITPVRPINSGSTRKAPPFRPG